MCVLLSKSNASVFWPHCTESHRKHDVNPIVLTIIFIQYILTWLYCLSSGSVSRQNMTMDRMMTITDQTATIRAASELSGYSSSSQTALLNLLTGNLFTCNQQQRTVNAEQEFSHNLNYLFERRSTHRPIQSPQFIRMAQASNRGKRIRCKTKFQ